MEKAGFYCGRYFILFIFFVFILLTTASSGCFESENSVIVSLEKTQVLGSSTDEDKPVRIGVFSMASPKTTMEYYQGFIDYFSEETGLEFELVQRDNPAEINYLMEAGYLDAVFVREDDYFQGHDDFGMKIIAVPVIQGDIHYSSYVIARSDSDINSLEDFHNKKIAFNSYRFTRGEVVPEYMLHALNQSPDSFFSDYIYSNSQDNFIDMISQGTLDGAEVDCIMWTYFVEKSPYYSSRLKIVYSSPSQLVPAVAVRPDMDPDMENTIKSTLLHMHDSEEGRKILDDMGFNMFVAMDHETYLYYGDGV